MTILSTLPDLPGRNYDVICVVVSQAKATGSRKNQELGEMFNDIVQQASDMGADAVIDVKMIAPSGTASGYSLIVVTGTAVKLR